MLPRIKISYLNGQLGTVGESADGLVALVCGATVVSGSFALNTVYTLHKPDELADLGVTATNNPRLYKHVKEFYEEAEEGTKLILYPVSKTTTMTTLCDNTSGALKELITQQNGALRAIFVAREDSSNPSVNAGLDPDVYTALQKAQMLADWATTQLYAPLFIALEGRCFTTTSNPTDLSKFAYNRCCVLIGDTEPDSKGACMGLMAGRVASISVQRNIGRVKDGALKPLEMYIGGKLVENCQSLVEDLYDLRYITPRKYIGRAGYYFADDNMACDPTDDYAHIAPRRVIDKAYRIAYDTMLNQMLDELEVNEDGTLQNPVIKSWQQSVENAINTQMTAYGELSASEDGGCKCFIDPEQNVVATSLVKVALKVRPFGYARYIDVNLGFLVTSSN